MFKMLKKTFSFILFFTLSIRPIYNIGYLAYYELNLDYIIEKYCVNKETPVLQCNGKCHLATQLAINTKETPEGNTYSLALLSETFVPVYFQKQIFCLNFFTKKNTTQNYWKHSKLLISLYQDRLDKPPQT